MLVIFSVALLFLPFVVNAEGPRSIQFFWAEGCPHCHDEKEFLDDYLIDKPEIRLESYEISKDKDSREKLSEIGKRLGADISGVPFTVAGDQYVPGFLKGTTEQKIIAMVENLGWVAHGSDEICTLGAPCEEGESSIEFNLPILGTIDSANFSLPVLSVILGLVDGFNPCAMWVLIFLISILLGMKDRKRMWLLGSVFIFASSLVYFLFMVAWLNFFLFIGLVVAVRIAIGLLALGVGAYNLREYATEKEAVCKVANSNKRRHFFNRIKGIIHKRSLFLAIIGIIALAFAVNLVELICSAGLPAIYTQILTLSDLPTWKYYLYILVYILFFMLDDLVVFIIAMKTLQLTGLTTKYTRISKLIGGIVMFILGLILILKPEWLMFS
jgi:glutaredoxin